MRARPVHAHPSRALLVLGLSATLAPAAGAALGPLSGHATVTRYGEFTVPQNNEALDQTFGAQWVLDLSPGVRLSSNLNLNGIHRYSKFSPNGFSGRFYHVKAAFGW